MHIYAFGSVCRGEIELDSDIDLLALVEKRDPRLSAEKFSIYTYEKVRHLWDEGNAFAWHLAKERSLVYSEDNSDFLTDLGMPMPYKHANRDSERLVQIFKESARQLEAGSCNIVFELSTMFLSVRNLATCYSLSMLDKPIFSRDSPLRIGDKSIDLTPECFEVLLRCRILSTRGYGYDIDPVDVEMVHRELPQIHGWVAKLSREIG